MNNIRISNVLLDVSRFQMTCLTCKQRFIFDQIFIYANHCIHCKVSNFSFPLLPSKLDHLVYVYKPRRTKVRFIILPNKQVQQVTTTCQMSDILSLVVVSQVLCNHCNRGRFRNAYYSVTVSITQKSVSPLSKITLQFIVYLTVSNKYNCNFFFLCTINVIKYTFPLLYTFLVITAFSRFT